jgi:hypothetical protein
VIGRWQEFVFKAVGLLLPAVRQAHEVARQSSGGNNLKQIGVGFHNYADSNGRSPSVQIMAGLEERASYDLYAQYFDQDVADDQQTINPANYGANLFRVVSWATCPSSTNSVVPTACSSGAGKPDAFNTRVGLVTYRENAGVPPTSGAWTQVNGGLTFVRPLGFKHFSDGTSKTVLANECATSVVFTRGGVSFMTANTSGSTYSGSWSPSVADLGTPMASATLKPSGLPNSKVGASFDGAHSEHAGGLFSSLFVDASTKFLPSSTDPDGFLSLLDPQWWRERTFVPNNCQIVQLRRNSLTGCLHHVAGILLQLLHLPTAV